MSIIKLFCDKDRALKYSYLVKSNFVKTLPEHKMISTLVDFYTDTGADVFNHDTFQMYLETKKVSDDEKVFYYYDYGQQIKGLDQIQEKIITDDIKSKELNYNIKQNLNEFEKGDLTNGDFYAKIYETVDKFSNIINEKVEARLVTDDIDAILEQEDSSGGLEWPLPCLNETMRPLMPGDFGIIAARPDAGKTSLVANLAIHFAKQLPEDMPVLWLNNEGLGKRIKLRLYQVALKCTIAELLKVKRNGLLGLRYKEATNGTNIHVYDIHELSNIEIEQIIKKHKPGVVIFDMIDNIRFLGGNHHGGTRTDQILESMYQWARNLCVIHEMAGLAVSQTSSDAENMKFPLMSMLKDSKTGKQGACDFIMMMGKDESIPDQRFISLPKNKLTTSTTSKKCPKAAVYFDGVRGTFSETFMDEDTKKSWAETLSVDVTEETPNPF